MPAGRLPAACTPVNELSLDDDEQEKGAQGAQAHRQPCRTGGGPGPVRGLPGCLAAATAARKLHPAQPYLAAGFSRGHQHDASHHMQGGAHPAGPAGSCPPWRKRLPPGRPATVFESPAPISDYRASQYKYTHSPDPAQGPAPEVERSAAAAPQVWRRPRFQIAQRWAVELWTVRRVRRPPPKARPEGVGRGALAAAAAAAAGAAAAALLQDLMGSWRG